MPTRSTILLVSVFSLSYLVCITEQQLMDPGNTTIPADNSTSSGLSHAASLFYGLLATTVTNLAALLGFVFTSAHRFSCYPVLISFMVAVAVGSLFSTAILVLVPEAFGLVNDPNYSHTYVPAAITVCVGAFVFFLLEFLLRRFRTIIAFCSGRQTSRSLTASCELRQVTSGDLEVVTPATVPIVNGGPQSKVNMSGHDHHSIKSFKSFDGTEPIRLCGPDTCQRIAHLDPVVWMIVIGDGMHNLMDGLSIGTGFASDWRLGLSLTLAILCEELPHELGDFAVLLRSGLSVGMALLFNFASACTAYLGFFVGFYLGDVGNASTYIFALTAGFFLYIALADMLPEIRKSEEERALTHGSSFGLFVAHSFGLVFGFGCIVAVTLLSEFITL